MESRVRVELTFSGLQSLSFAGTTAHETGRESRQGYDLGVLRLGENFPYPSAAPGTTALFGNPEQATRIELA